MTSKDISPSGGILNIEIKVININEVLSDSSVKYYMEVRDLEGSSLDMVLFEDNPSASYNWQEGQWYRLENVYGHYYNGDPQLKPPRDEAIEITLLDKHSSKKENSDSKKPLSQQSGPTLLQTRLVDTYEELDVYLHQINLDTGFQGDASELTARVAHRYRSDSGSPVTSFGDMRLVSTQRLNGSQIVDGYTVSLDHVGSRTLTASSDSHRETIASLAKQDIKQALYTNPKYDVLGINTIVEQEPVLTSRSGKFDAHRKYHVRVRVDSDGVVLCGILVSHRFVSSFTADEFIQRGHDITGITVEHDPRYYQTKGSAEVLGLSDFHYTDSIPEIGGNSIKKFHVDKERVDPQIAEKVAEEDPQLLYVDYDGSADQPEDGNLQAPQYLRIIPTLDMLQKLDEGFHDRAISESRLEPSKRVQLCHELLQDIGKLTGLKTEIETTFDREAYINASVDNKKKNLEFGNGHRNRVGKWGLNQTGVFQEPDPYTVQALVPSQHSKLGEKYVEEIQDMLKKLDAAPSRLDITEYKFGSQFTYAETVAEVTDHDVVLAIVPDETEAKKRDYTDPHDIFKRQLGNNGVPSQMVTVSQLSNNSTDSLMNVAVGLIAAVGGVPWRIADIPGDADAFIGLDVHYSQDDDQHIGASANLVLADGTIFSSRAISTQKGEEFSIKEITNAIGDVLQHYIRSTGGEQFDHLIILRDGRLYVDINKVEAELTGLQGNVSIVDVQKSGIPRIVSTNGDGNDASIPPKGTALIHKKDNYAIMTTTGEPEPTPGTPQPLRVEKRSGPIEMETLCRQLYWLSEAHVGSVSRSARLPAPIYYADLCAESAAKGHIITGDVINGLPFL